MRCRCCNKKLDKGELSKKDNAGRYLDTCAECMATVYDTLSDYKTDYVLDMELELDKE